MFGLPIIFWQILIPVLRAIGFANWAENLSLKLIVGVADKLKKLQTYHENSDFPQPYPASTTMHNFTVTQPKS